MALAMNQESLMPSLVNPNRIIGIIHAWNLFPYMEATRKRSNQRPDDAVIPARPAPYRSTPLGRTLHIKLDVYHCHSFDLFLEERPL